MAGVVAALVSQGTTAGFTAGLTSSNGTFASGTAILADTIGGTTCTSSPSTVSTNTTNCATNPVSTGTLPASGTVSQTTTLNAPGTLMSAVKATGLSCGIQDVRDASSAGANTGIVHQTVTFGSGGPLTGTALAFTQSSSAYVSTIKSYVDPETFSIAAWFKYAAGDSGTIIGFSDDSVDSGDANSDRSLWLSGGKLYWGVSPAGTQQEVNSGAGLTAGTWHLAVASIGATGERLYIDGTLAGSTAGVTAAKAYTGYWHVGWGDETGWANAPANAYWPGALADVAVIPSQLSAAQVTTLWTQATNANEQTQILARAPTAFWPLDDAGTAIYSGNVPGAGIPPFTDATGAGNTGTGNGTFTTDGAGPLGGAGQTFDGSTSWMSSTTQFVDPHPLTITAWFKTTVGGTIIEYTNIQNGLTGNTTWDRHIWVDAAGHLVWGVWNGGDDQITSPGSYIDGNWHQVAASVGPTGMRLYVDGTLVATNAAVTVPEVSNGYWRLGDGNENNVWVDPPPNVLWQGSLSQVAVYPAQLTAAQITALTTPTTATAYQSAVLALTPTSYWELNQGPASPGCAAVNVTIQTTTGATVACALPAGAGACPAPSSAATLASWGAATLTGLTAGGSQTVKLTLARGSVPLSLVGVHVSGTMSFSATGAGFTAVLNHNYGQVTL
jgi:Concanavalin A-like lectin/glucanases superfamily